MELPRFSATRATLHAGRDDALRALMRWHNKAEQPMNEKCALTGRRRAARPHIWRRSICRCFASFTMRYIVICRLVRPRARLYVFAAPSLVAAGLVAIAIFRI